MHLQSDTLLQGGKYKVIEKIGQGGFGIVYRAFHQGLHCDVCIKEFFFRDLCERGNNSSQVSIISTSAEKIQLVESLRKKFIKEAQRLAQFRHQNIIQVMDNFEENNTAYFVMEYLEGGSLEDLIERNGALSEQKAKELILPIIDAIEIVHEKGLLHLDIKPANIMLRKNQSPVLIDFGISKYMDMAGGYTTTAPIGLSKGYAPLEQYGGTISDFNRATDYYSLCATLYKIITGLTPVEPLQILANGLKSPQAINSKISDSINALIIKGLSVKSIDRQQAISEIRNGLRVNQILIKQDVNSINKTIPIVKDEIVKDIDGNCYHVVKIGNQEWLVENLKTTRYRNGDVIGTTSPATKSFLFKLKPKFQWSYEGNEANVNKYGRLYTWHAAVDSRGIAPVGWRIPSIEDWNILKKYLRENGYSVDKEGCCIAKSMASKENWKKNYGYHYHNDPNANLRELQDSVKTIGAMPENNNSSGFTAQPGGFRDSNNCQFCRLGEVGRWWSNSETPNNNSCSKGVWLMHISETLLTDDFNKESGCSIRCMRDV